MQDSFGAYLNGEAYQLTPLNEAVAAGAAYAMALTTGDCLVLMDSRSVVTSCDEFALHAYDAQTFTGGTPTPMVNRNRRYKDKVPTFTAFGDVATTPTGDPFSVAELSPGNGNAVINFLGEVGNIWMFAPSTTYTLILTNNAAQAHNFKFQLVLRCIMQSEVN